MNKLPKIIRKGYIQALDGKTSIVNTKTDEMIKIIFKDRKQQFAYYCKYVKITIEVIDETEFNIDKDE